MKNYNELYKPIQINALDLEGVDFNASIIDSVIDTVLLELTDKYSKIIEDTNNYITPVPTANDLLLIIYKSALLLLAPSGGNLSYKTPILSVGRGETGTEQISWLKDKIFELSASDLISSDSDVEMVYEGADRMADLIETIAV